MARHSRGSQPRRSRTLRSLFASGSVDRTLDARRASRRLRMEALEDRRVLATFTVTNTNDAGVGSLRQAILDANADVSVAVDTIDFNIAAAGVQTIAPLSGLPTITDGVNIDATTQPGFAGTPLIELDGSGAGLGGQLVLGAGSAGSTIRGFIINGFAGDGVTVSSDSNTIAGNFIGVNAAGTAADANVGAGVSLIGSNNTVGGTGANDGNVISGNGVFGVGIGAAGGVNNVVQGNLIGVAADGVSPIPNADDGVQILGGSANTIGGVAPGEANTIAFNGSNGVVVAGAADDGNEIRGNSIFENSGLGIDLADNGVTVNDAADPDNGPNQEQNTPQVVGQATLVGGTVSVTYSVDTSPANAAFPLQIDFYVADADGEEGQTYIGTDAYPAPGNAVFTFDAATAGVAAGDQVAFTATDAAGNTSEFATFFITAPMVLGSDPAVIVNGLTLAAGESDFFQITANQTGKLILNTFFDHDFGDLSLTVLDRFGNTIDADNTSSPTQDFENVIIPVVGQEKYFVRVDAVSVPVGTQTYDLEIENFAAPAPSFVDLATSSDTGESSVDNVTGDTTPTFLIQADLSDFSDMGITLLSAATIDPDGDGDAADATDDGAGVFVTLINLTSGATVEGFANAVGPSGLLWSFTSPALTDGDWFVSAAVQVVDGQDTDDVAAGTQRENGRAQFGPPLTITVVDPAAAPLFTADLLASSDTGLLSTDNVTAKWEPTLVGVAPAGATVRAFADGLLVGQTVTGSDSSDVGAGGVGGVGGAAADGLGLWQITTAPLDEGGYDLTFEVEDAGGGVTTFNPQFNPQNAAVDIVIDKTAPNTPLLDLVTASDTGGDLADEITADNTPTVTMTTTDPNVGLANLLFTDNLRFRIFNRFEGAAEALLYDSATDAAAEAVSVGGDSFTALTLITATLGPLADGVHNLKLEVEDRAGNLSEDFLLELVVDTAPPAAVTPDLLATSDTGMFDDDNVTAKWEPAFGGVAEINNKVFVYADPVDPATGAATGTPILVGEGVVGSENSNNIAGDGLGAWEVTVEPLDEGVYDISVRFEDPAGNFTPLADSIAAAQRIAIDKTAPNTPLLDLVDDSGRSDVDDITMDNTPMVTMTTTDPNIAFAQALSFTDNLKFRVFNRFENNAEFLLYDSTLDTAVADMQDNADTLTALTFITEVLPQQFADGGGVNAAVLAGGVLADGVHNLKLEVEDRAGNLSEDFLLSIEIDTVVPPVSFGDPTVPVDGLLADSDTGVLADPPTLEDRVTADSTPTFWGVAEADSVVRVFADVNGNGAVDAGDLLLGQTVATPLDGNNAFADGRWDITSAIDLNEPSVFAAVDGVRSLLVTAEDVAGNVNLPNDNLPDAAADAAQALDIFLDTQGPRVEGVFVTGARGYDLFDPKPATDGPTPLVNSLDIDLTDLPNRTAEFLYAAANEQIVTDPGRYQLVGDSTGFVAIASIAFTDDTVAGGPGDSTVTLTFVEPLADDRYTLTIRDTLTDDAGNALDGESNAAEPQEDPAFPTGDGVPGGDFIGRFTVDSRPELGTFVAQNISIDANGNFVWDPATGAIGEDATNVDLQFTLPVAAADGSIGQGGYNVSDLVFAGRFGLGLGDLIVGDDTVFVVDVSGSTSENFGGTAVGDLNGDGDGDTVLDAQIAAFTALNDELISQGLGATARVGIAAFSTNSDIIDVDPVAAGIQTTTTPTADADGNGVFDIVQALQGLSAGGTTNFEAGLQDAIAILDAAGIPNNSANVVFLSDGNPNEGGSFTDEATEIAATRGQNLRAFGVGPGASLADLLLIDPLAVTFSSTDELLGVFAGGGAGGVAGGAISGFDTLAAYGFSQELGSFRWIIDQNHDGVVSLADGEILSLQPEVAGFDIQGALPVAGNFDGNATNGDEIGLYKAGSWAFDTNRNFVIEASEVFSNGLLGHPIIGDFDGDGADDAGVFNNNQFFFDFAFNNFNGVDQTIVWGFPGVLDRPVSADFDQDGVDDIGLWVPRNSSATPRPQAEWYIQLSGGDTPIVGQALALDHPFTPEPFGDDLYAEFGDELALPIVGNFDPPVAGAQPTAQPAALTADASGDFNGDGVVDQTDHGLWSSSLGQTDSPAADANGDGVVNAADYTVWAANRTAPPPTPASVRASLVMAGDYDANGRIDSGDHAVFAASYGGDNPAADGNGDGVVNLLDYLVMRTAAGSVASGFVSTASPVLLTAAAEEPAPAEAAPLAVEVTPSAAPFFVTASADGALLPGFAGPVRSAPDAGASAAALLLLLPDSPAAESADAVLLEAADSDSDDDALDCCFEELADDALAVL